MAQGDNFKGRTGKIPSSGIKKGEMQEKTKLVKDFLTSKDCLEKIESGELMSPLTYLVSVVNDPEADPAARRECAKAVIKYTNSAKPTFVESVVTTTQPALSLTELYAHIGTKGA